MVDAAAKVASANSVTTQEYPIGTPVYNSYPGGWKSGKITAFEDSKYVVTFEDGTSHKFSDAKDIQKMVEAAEQKAIQAMSGGAVSSPAATAVIVVAVLALSAIVVVVVIRRKRSRKEMPPPPPANPYHDACPPEKSHNIADLKATSADII